MPQTPVTDSFVEFTEAALLLLLDKKEIFGRVVYQTQSEAEKSKRPTWINQNRDALARDVHQGMFLKAALGARLGGKYQYATINEYVEGRDKYVLRYI